MTANLLGKYINWQSSLENWSDRAETSAIKVQAFKRFALSKLFFFFSSDINSQIVASPPIFYEHQNDELGRAEVGGKS